MSLSSPAIIIHSSMIAIALLLSLSSCNARHENKSSHSTKPNKSSPTSVLRFGEAIKPGTRPAKLANIINEPHAWKDKQVVVEGKVRAVCEKKGCWMEIVPNTDDKNQSCRVTFEDYSFFVPKDSAGSWARLEGIVKTNKIPKEMVAHYEAEGATFASKQPDGSASEVQIIATGVELNR